MPDKKTILIVDDDPEICEALQEILTDYDYHVLTAQDTVTAGQLVEEQRPNLLILDIMMATMDDGLRFASRIKQKEGVWGIPILIVSARPPVEKGYSRSVTRTSIGSTPISSWKNPSIPKISSRTSRSC